MRAFWARWRSSRACWKLSKIRKSKKVDVSNSKCSSPGGIIELIKVASDLGHFTITIENELSWDQFFKLEDMGYNVRSDYAGIGEPSGGKPGAILMNTVISWY